MRVFVQMYFLWIKYLGRIKLLSMVIFELYNQKLNIYYLQFCGFYIIFFYNTFYIFLDIVNIPK